MEHIDRASTGQCVSTLSGHSRTVNSVCFAPDGKRLASGSSDNTVRVWDLDTKECACTLSDHSDTVTSVCFSPDGKQLASGSGDKTVRVWDVITLKCIPEEKGHVASSRVANSSDGKLQARANVSLVQVHQVVGDSSYLLIWCASPVNQSLSLSGCSVVGVKGLSDSDARLIQQHQKKG